MPGTVLPEDFLRAIKHIDYSSVSFSIISAFFLIFFVIIIAMWTCIFRCFSFFFLLGEFNLATQNKHLSELIGSLFYEKLGQFSRGVFSLTDTMDAHDLLFCGSSLTCYF